MINRLPGLRTLAVAAGLFLRSYAALADEGMWLPLHIARLNIADMQKAGCKLSAEQIYSVNSSSLKDAIVSFGGFCTGEIISPEGLILTNHHCGYDAIQSHSSVEKNYLRDGFWAYKKTEEIPTPGLFVKFLVRMEDVSARVKAKLNDKMTEAERAKAAEAEMAEIRKEATSGNGYDAEVKPFFDANEYYLMVYEIYRDVRLVGTPPESVGKFGGDTDNWMWPRHTGDFSLFRVYSGKDGKPASYSAENVPLKPRHFLPVSTSGVKEGDFTMVFGFPGRTNRFLTSYGVKLALDITNPTIVSIRDKKLRLMKENMDVNPAIRIKYASKYAQIANYWKYFIGQSQGLNRLDVVDKKLAEETAFQQWADADPARKERYGKVLSELSAAYETVRKFRKTGVFLQEGVLGSEMLQLGLSFNGLQGKLAASKDPSADPEIRKMAEELKAELPGHFKDFDLDTDRKIFRAMMEMYRKEVSPDQQPEMMARVFEKKYKGNAAKWADDVYNKSMFASLEKLNAFLDKPTAKALAKDPAFQIANDFYMHFLQFIQPQSRPADVQIARCNRLYVEGTLKMQEGVRTFYPNANSTMRLTYGKVGAYKPRDAAFYDYKTTLEGIIEKEDPNNEEFIVPAKLKELYMKKDYGRWAENGTVPVGFIGNTDITGGNSGSPVINGRGELVGLAFDGNWEAMSGDIAFEPTLQRTISCDIRYVLFIVDKYAGAQNLINEMKLVEAPAEMPLLSEPPKISPPPAEAQAPAVPQPKGKATQPAGKQTAPSKSK